MTREVWGTLRPGDWISGPAPATTPRKVVSISTYGPKCRGWKSKQMAADATHGVSLAIRRLSWTRRPYTVYSAGDAGAFELVRRASKAPKTISYCGGRYLSLRGQPKEIRGIVRDNVAAVADELETMEGMRRRGVPWITKDANNPRRTSQNRGPLA